MAAVRHDLVIRPAIAKLRLSLCVSRKLHFSPRGRNRARVKACLERCEYTRIMCDLARALYQPSRYSVERGSCCTPDSQGPKPSDYRTTTHPPTDPANSRSKMPPTQSCLFQRTHTHLLPRWWEKAYRKDGERIAFRAAHMLAAPVL